MTRLDHDADRPDVDLEPEDYPDESERLDLVSLDAPVSGLATGADGIPTRAAVPTVSAARTLLVLVATAALVLGGVWLVNRKPAAEGAAAGGTTAVQLSQDGTGPAPEVGKPAQDFTATTVDGTPITLASLKGKAVWLTFGASWCQACQAEAPDIQAAYDKAKASGVTVVQIFISEDAAAVTDYANRVGLTYAKVADPDTTIASAYRVSAIPAQFFIGRDGVLQQMRTGGMVPTEMDAALAAIAR